MFSIQRTQWQWLGFCLGFLVISISTLLPADQLPPVPGTDKLHHLLGFGGWAALCAFGVQRRFRNMCLFIVFWGGMIEIIQPYVNRYGEWNDFIADTAGVILVYCSVQLLKHLNVRSQKS